MPGSFFDTNILVYLTSDDTAKADRAEQLLTEGGAISLQVLNELANLARRKLRYSWPRTHAFISSIRTLLTVHPVTLETHQTGLALAERHQLPIYDAMIAAAALNAGCDTLWSEDLHHGLLIEQRLRVANPFRT